MALFTSIMSYALNPIAIAKGYRLAYQEVDKAIFNYRKDGMKNEEVLASALVEGEKYISNILMK